jgi:hypothetical protein
MRQPRRIEENDAQPTRGVLTATGVRSQNAAYKGISLSRERIHIG